MARWPVVRVGVGMVRKREGNKDKKREKRRRRRRRRRRKREEEKGEKGGGAADDGKRWILGFVFEWVVEMKCENGGSRRTL